MLTLLPLEFRKLLGFRSARLGLLVSLLLPIVWAVAPRLSAVMGVPMSSGWHLPAVSYGIAIQTLIPLFIAVTVAELIGSEVTQGTLAPLLLRPVDRVKIILAKLGAALTYPVLLILATLIGSLIAGIPFGYGNFTGGTGLGPGMFQGVGDLSSGAAFAQVLHATLLAMAMLLPVAALALLFGVLYLNTAAAALATVAFLSIMRLLVVFPEGIQKVLLTNYLNLYTWYGQDPATRMGLGASLILLLIYTVGFAAMTVYAFDRRDV